MLCCTDAKLKFQAYGGWCHKYTDQCKSFSQLIKPSQEKTNAHKKRLKRHKIRECFCSRHASCHLSPSAKATVFSFTVHNPGAKVVKHNVIRESQSSQICVLSRGWTKAFKLSPLPWLLASKSVSEGRRRWVGCIKKRGEKREKRSSYLTLVGSRKNLSLWNPAKKHLCGADTAAHVFPDVLVPHYTHNNGEYLGN